MPRKRPATTVVRCRVTAEQKQTILANAEALGMNASEFIRSAATMPVEVSYGADVDHGARRPVGIVVYPSVLLLYAQQLRRVGNNYNQCTKALNTIANKDAGQIRACVNAVLGNLAGSCRETGEVLRGQIDTVDAIARSMPRLSGRPSALAVAIVEGGGKGGED